MSKILSQAGNSLADIYDVEGSIAGIDHLETHDLPIVHEVGATVFSERFATTTRRMVSPATAQNTNIDVTLTNLPAQVTRLLALVVFSDSATRISNLMVAVRDPVAPIQEVPIWVYEGGTSSVARFEDDGTGVTVEVLVPDVSLVAIPTFIGGSGQQNPNMVQEIAMRGLTTGFGAGTVLATAVLYFAFSQVLGTNSRGLPIPSW